MKRPNYVFDDELYHHGIPGQKWGERRFQNEDGSWTPEGRERYGKGEKSYKEIKSDHKFKTYESKLKSKEQLRSDKNAAKEERNRIKELAKTEKLKLKEQAKIEEYKNKQQAKVNESNNKLKNTKNMTNDELQDAINRLNLEIQYNKSYAIAKNPNNALVKADQFFESSTGKIVSQIAVNTLPQLIQQSTSKILDKKLAGDKSKYEDPLDKAAKEAEIRRTNAQASSFESVAQKNFSDIQKNSSNNEKITQEIISLPRANPNNARSSDIGRTQAIQTPYIGKTESVSPAPGTPGGRRLYAWEANELNKKKKKS